jgi:hypothetical protein
MSANTSQLPDDVEIMREQISQTRAELAGTVSCLRDKAVADAKSRAKQAGLAVVGITVAYLATRLIRHRRTA